MAEHITQREAASAVHQLDNVRDRQKEQRFFLSELMGAAAGGFAVGYAVTKNPELTSMFGGRVSISHVVALGGIYLGRRKGKMAAAARGAGLGALYSITHTMGASAAVPSV